MSEMKYESQKYAGGEATDWARCVASYAPKGMKLGVLVKREGDEFNVRLFSASTIGRGEGNPPEIVRIDSLCGEKVVNELSRRLQAIVGPAVVVGGVGYWGWDATDGTKMSGLRVSAVNDGKTNFVYAVVYGLAEIVHGDRNAWGIFRLDGHH